MLPYLSLLDNAADLVSEVGYVALPESLYEIGKQRFAQHVVGTVFDSTHDGAKSLEDRFRVAMVK